MPEQLIEGIHNFVIVIIDLHFQVQTCVFGEVPVGIRVLCAKDGSNLIHPFHITGDAHLLGELRALRVYCECFDNGRQKITLPEQGKLADGNSPP
jgi:hypothetical protein